MEGNEKQMTGAGLCDGLIFPQPTQEELDAEPDRFIALNEYWRKILSMMVDEINVPERWEDIEQVLEGINALDWFEPMPELICGNAKLGSNQSLNSATTLKIPIDTSVKMEGMTFANNEITVVTAGYYAVSGVIGYSTGGGYRAGEIRVNNSTRSSSSYGNSGIAQLTINNHIQLKWEGDLAVGDDISIIAFHQSTAAINVLGSGHTWLAAHLVR